MIFFEDVHEFLPQQTIQVMKNLLELAWVPTSKVSLVGVFWFNQHFLTVHFFHIFEGISLLNVSSSSFVSNTVQGQCTCQGLLFSVVDETFAQIDDIFVSDNSILCTLVSSGIVLESQSNLHCSNSVFQRCQVLSGAGLFNLHSESPQIDIKISNCSARNVTASSTGAFLSYADLHGVAQSGSVIVQNSSFTDLHAATKGGAISAISIPIGNYPAFLFLNSSCTGCTSLLGGCLHLESFNIEVSSSVFANNSALFGDQPTECTRRNKCGEGGAVWSQNGDLRVVDSLFTSNSADAAASLLSRFPLSAFIDNSSFHSNLAATDGSILLLFNPDIQLLSIQDSFFLNNTSTQGSAAVSLIFLDNGIQTFTGLISNTRFESNFGLGYQASVYVQAFTYQATSNQVGCLSAPLSSFLTVSSFTMVLSHNIFLNNLEVSDTFTLSPATTNLAATAGKTVLAVLTGIGYFAS